MKKLYLLVLLILIGVFSHSHSQTTVTLIFTATTENLHQPLDSIIISNISQGGDTTLYYNDTVLILDCGTSVSNITEKSTDNIILYPAFPNPFSGSTTSRFYLKRKQNVTIRIFDISGREVLYHAEMLQKGYHNYTIHPGNDNIYILSVETPYSRKVQKLICIGNSGGKPRIDYSDYNSDIRSFKKSKGTFNWSPGDYLRFIGYTTLGINAYDSDTINDNPSQSNLYSFLFSISVLYPPGTIHCDPNNPTAIVNVTNPITGKTWMDRNLGASQLATSINDASAFGDLYQWGRFADGHQCRTSDIATILSSTDNPGHGNFILPPNEPFDWRLPQNNSLWQGVSGINNPCPIDYRLPTIAELEAERASWISNNGSGAFNNPLKFTKAGLRYYNTGLISYESSKGQYWSSSIDGTNANSIQFDSIIAGEIFSKRAYGFSVRCIKQDPVPPGQPSVISGPIEVCENSTGIVYSVINEPFVTYNWVVPTGWVITSGQGTNQITVNTSSNPGIIEVIPENSYGVGPSQTLSVIIHIIPGPPSYITGDNNPCNYDTVNYSVISITGITYTWNVPSDWTIISGQGTNTIDVISGASTGNITVTPSNICGNGPTQTISVSPQTIPAQPPAINGNTNPCQGFTGVYFVNGSVGIDYTWDIPSDWIILAGQGSDQLAILVGADTGYIVVTPSNSCGSGPPNSLAVNTQTIPGQPSVIYGNNNPCQNDTLTYNVVSTGGVSYSWNVPYDWVILSGQGTNQIVVVAGTAAGNITITPSNSCGTGNSQSLFVTSTTVPDQPYSIIGNNAPCQNDTVTYSVLSVAGVSYTWNVPSDWTIISGQGTNTIDVISGASTGNITVTPSNICGNGPMQTISVSPQTIPAQPSTITGNTSPIFGLTYVYSVSNITGVNYHWDVPSDWIILAGNSTHQIAVTVGADTGNVLVTPYNLCGNGLTQTISVFPYLIPDQPSQINGPVNPCENSTGNIYSVSNVAGITYTWSVPAGWTINSGQGTHEITVTAGTNPGIIEVTPTNAAGQGLSQTLSVITNTIPSQPSPISGHDSICESTYEIYSVIPISGTNYSWQVPSGWSIISGHGTHEIEIIAGALSGIITVTPNNSCGYGDSISLMINTEVIPTSPTEGNHIIGQEEIEWHWNSISGASGYKTNTTNDFPGAIDLGTTTSYIDSLLSCQTNYTRFVWAYNDCGASQPILFNKTTLNCPCGTPFTDPRDNNVYQTIQIGNQCWLAENLKYLPKVTYPSNVSDFEARYYVYGYYGTNVSTAKSTNNYIQHGVLYNWAAAMNDRQSSNSSPSGIQGVCPPGWHIPSLDEVKKLRGYVRADQQNRCGGNTNYIAKSLSSTTGWETSSTFCAVGENLSTNNNSGFSAQPSGTLSSSIFGGIGQWATWWTSTEPIVSTQSRACDFYFSYNCQQLWDFHRYKENGISIRCLRDEHIPGQPSHIEGDQNICSNSSGNMYSVISEPGNSYTWNVPTGWSIISGQGTSEIDVLSGTNNGYVRVIAENAFGAGLYNRTLWVNVQNNSPATPVEDVHIADDFSIEWKWNSVAEASGYKWNTVNDHSSAIDLGNVTFYNETQLMCDTNYTRYLWAYNGCGSSTVVIISASTLQCQQSYNCGGSFIDLRDSNLYWTVQIGNQCWMAENLRYLPDIVDETTGSEVIPYYYVYGYSGNDVIAAKSTVNYAKYGVLYNWAAAISGSESSNNVPSGVQGICPPGWHLPSNNEWGALQNYMGGSPTAGGKLKEGGYLNWNSPNTGATNSSGFTGLPGGMRHYHGTFNDINSRGAWWSATQYWSATQKDYKSYAFRLSNNINDGLTEYINKNFGLSVRCLRDTGFSAFSIPVIATDSVWSILPNSAVSGGNITNNGGTPVLSRGVCWSTNPNPTLYNSHTTDSIGLGTFVSNITGLDTNTTYYVRAYATNIAGTAYGNQQLFTTLPPDTTVINITVPFVDTDSILSIMPVSAVSGGTITSDGGAPVLSRGVCWSTDPNPTLNDTHTNDGIGMGSFISSFSNLDTATTYYIRAYATNNAGTAYGDQHVFTTLSPIMDQPCQGMATITDYNGNIYNTVQIGSQCWMKENLMATNYNNGTPITIVTDNSAWTSITSGAMCWYNNDSAAYANTFGALYNWYAVDSGNLCPPGWHVPSDSDWQKLEMYLGMNLSLINSTGWRGTSNEGGKMKQIGTNNWGALISYSSYNVGANNSSGFTALPGGHRHHSNGDFQGIYYNGCWWSSTSFSVWNSFYRNLTYNDNNVGRMHLRKRNGLSVRCVKDL